MSDQAEQLLSKPVENKDPEYTRRQLADACEQLGKFGGFDLLVSSIDDVQNLDPGKNAARSIFLADAKRSAERDTLLKLLSLWAEVIGSSDSIADMAMYCDNKTAICEQEIKTNLLLAVETSKDLERAYKNVAFFFANTQEAAASDVSFLNTDLNQLKDLDDPRVMKVVTDELTLNYDRLDLRNNYSILVLSGYLGSNAVMDKWARIAHQNKVMLITDFEHLDGVDDVMEMFDHAGLTSGDIFKSNVMMPCNWLVGRGKYKTLGEHDDLYVPPSGALAGKVYSTLMSQVTAGKKFGVLDHVEGVRFELKKSEVANLERLGLIPMIKDNGKVMAFSAKTLFNGDNLGLQTYSVVRVFDYVTKVLIDFLNRQAFENFNSNTRKDLMNQVVKFLDSITGPDKLIEDFTIRRFEQDPVQKDKIHLDIHMKPYFPAKNFMIKMDGKKGTEGTTAWGTEYSQQ